MTLTTDHPNDKDPQCPPRADPGNHNEQPLYLPLPPPFHEFRCYKELSVHLTHLLLHLTRLNHHNPTCSCYDDKSSLPSDAFNSNLAEYYHSLNIPPIIHPQNPANYLDNKPTFRVYAKAGTDYSLTIRYGKVTVAPANPSDLNQHWIKDDRFGLSIKDEEGNPAFALVNKATGQAMKCSIGVNFPVQLKEYKPDEVDMTVLWTQGKESDDVYRSVRPVNIIHLNVDVFTGRGEYIGVHDGAEISLREGSKYNQRWIIFPYCKSLNTNFTR